MLRLSIQDTLINYIDKISEFNENLDTIRYRPTHFKCLEENYDYFEVQACKQ